MQSSPDQLRVTVPFKLVLASITALWAVYFLLATIRWEIMGLGLNGEMLALRATVVVVGCLVTLALWSVLRLFDQRNQRIKSLAALTLSVPAALMLAQVNSMTFANMNDRIEGMFFDSIAGSQSDQTDLIPGANDSFRSQAKANFQRERDAYFEGQKDSLGMFAFLGPLVGTGFSYYFMALAWCAFYLALLAAQRARAAERRAGEFRAAAKAFELQSLRYQVNPHFLFNTLNSLSSLIMTGKMQDAEQMIQIMSRFYRTSLAGDPTSDVPLQDEFDLQKLYLQIEAVRFPNRLRSSFDLPDEISNMRVPGMIIQPLVENSVKYAVSQASDPICIRVSARLNDNILYITVSDDGQFSSGGLPGGMGIGLANVRDRLEARFGPSIEVFSGPDTNGYSTELRIPIDAYDAK